MGHTHSSRGMIMGHDHGSGEMMMGRCGLYGQSSLLKNLMRASLFSTRDRSMKGDWLFIFYLFFHFRYYSGDL